jgi:hypothetical protein
MAGIDYRQLQAPEQVDTSLPSSGAAARAAVLSQTFKDFAGVTGDVAEKLGTQAGALAGAAAGATGHPQYKQGLVRLTAYGRAFNNAATGAYLVQAEAQADDAAARLRVEANNNPATFQATYSAVRDAVLKNAPALAVPMLTELYNKRLASGMAALSGDQATELQQLHRKTYDEGVARQTSRVAILQGSDNPQDQAASLDEHAKLSVMIDGGVNAGLYSPAEAAAMHVTALKTITAQVFQTQVDRELARPDGDVIGLLENFRKAHIANVSNPNEPPILSEPEFQKLMQDATTKIREQNMLVAMNKREGKTAEQLKFEAGDLLYTSKLLSGHLSDADLDAGVRSGDLKPERATSLHMMLLQGRQQAKSDPRALFKLHTDPNFMNMSLEEISAYPGINDADRLKAYQEQQSRRNSWEGTQASRQAVGAIGAALKIVPGTPTAAMSEEQRRAFVDAHQEYIGIVNGLKPSEQQNPAALSAAAQTAIQHAKQREAQANIEVYSRARQRYIDTHGPQGQEPVDEKTFKDRVKHYDDMITQSRAAAKGQ